MAAIVYEDLSGSTTPIPGGGNPYQALISASNDDPKILQSRYETHRSTRNEQQKAKILNPQFSGWIPEQNLAKLQGPQRDPQFRDERFCSTFWGRPPQHIRSLIHFVQQELKHIAPTLWLMPLDHLHITVVELAHSLTEPEIETLVSTLQKSRAASEIVDFTLNHRARLIKPMISFDSSAMALSFVPAAGEGKSSPEEDSFTYHHLRREVYDKAVAGGVKPASRYSVPSAHLTIARFITNDGWLRDNAESGNQPGVDCERIKVLIDKIDALNVQMQTEYWPQEDGTIKSEGEWLVGQEKGLDFRKGQLWYGGGMTVLLGKGF